VHFSGEVSAAIHWAATCCDRQNNQSLIIGNQGSPQWERQGRVLSTHVEERASLDSYWYLSCVMCDVRVNSSTRSPLSMSCTTAHNTPLTLGPSPYQQPSTPPCTPSHPPTPPPPHPHRPTHQSPPQAVHVSPHLLCLVCQCWWQCQAVEGAVW